MCSLSFLPHSKGAFLAMNRDELNSRPIALPPALVHCGSLAAIYPAEPSGGTWVGVNECGLSLALLNWNIRPDSDHPASESRGRVIPLLLEKSGSREAAAMLERIDLGRTKPFRLIMTVPRERHLSEWMWDGMTLESRPHDWVRTHWFSSGIDEAGAQHARSSALCDAESAPHAGSREWILSLHRSHLPERSAYSICMHRADASTVSLTTIEMTVSQARMSYLNGPPCLDLTPLDMELSLTASSGEIP
jgi:hypothetical protein